MATCQAINCSRSRSHEERPRAASSGLSSLCAPCFFPVFVILDTWNATYILAENMPSGSRFRRLREPLGWLRISHDTGSGWSAWTG